MTSASEGFFISDYENDAKKGILDHVDKKFANNLPTQTDEWGCVTATGAFIINRLTQADIVNPSVLDTRIGRNKEKPGDTSLLALEFLNSGLSIDSHAPFSPLDAPSKKLIHGEIDFDTYFKIFQEHYGDVTEENYYRLRDYYMNTFIPSALAAETRFIEYEKSGQSVTHNESPITESLLEEMVNEGKYVFATETMDAGVEHAIAIFRPSIKLPALIFNPDVEESGIEVMTRCDFENISSSPIGAVALWSQLAR